MLTPCGGFSCGSLRGSRRILPRSTWRFQRGEPTLLPGARSSVAAKVGAGSECPGLWCLVVALVFPVAARICLVPAPQFTCDAPRRAPTSPTWLLRPQVTTRWARTNPAALQVPQLRAGLFVWFVVVGELTRSGVFVTALTVSFNFYFPLPGRKINYPIMCALEHSTCSHVCKYYTNLLTDWKQLSCGCSLKFYPLVDGSLLLAVTFDLSKLLKLQSVKPLDVVVMTYMLSPVMRGK